VAGEVSEVGNNVLDEGVELYVLSVDRARREEQLLHDQALAVRDELPLHELADMSTDRTGGARERALRA
jgi:hypothetical protein